jgi:predicted nucleic acid-binding protein
MSSTKPSIYIDTNIFSVLHYRGGDPVVLDQQSATRGWWELERINFNLCTSKITDDELSTGVFRAQKDSVAAVRKVIYLPFTNAVRGCASLYLRASVVPQAKTGDAFQLAFASVNMIDYLLTWNHAHLANADTQRKVEQINRANGWRAPLLVTPLTIPRRSFGQELRRRHE